MLLTQSNLICGSYTKFKTIILGGGGGLQPKKPKKTSPKFEICSVRFFRFSSVFFGFSGTFSVFFGLNFDKEFQPFKIHVNNEILGGQELPNKSPVNVL